MRVRDKRLPPSHRNLQGVDQPLIVGEIIPELWMKDHAAHLRGAVKREQVGELTILTPKLPQASIAK
jgi:hypothetical protein